MKGEQYEREICRKLSLWWTSGDDDGVFWRTSQSGGRATSRAKSGKDSLHLQGSDVTAIDPIGIPLMKAFAIEIKRGYNRDGSTLSDLMDQNYKVSHKKPTKLHQWIQQCRESQRQNNSLYWWLIHRRDQRIATLTMPLAAFKNPTGKFIMDHTRFNTILYNWFPASGRPERLIQVRFFDFLEQVGPQYVHNLLLS